MIEAQLNFRRYGSGERAVLFLHGLFGSAKNWHTQASALSGDFSAYTVDLRNHGASPHCAHMDYPGMAADVLALMDRLDIEQACLLGHSMGGKVAMQIALQAGVRVHRLIVVDIAPRAYPRHHDEVLEAMQALDLSAHRTRQAVDAALRAGIPDERVRQFILTNLVRDRESGAFVWQLHLPGIVDNYDHLSMAPTGAPYDGPTLFIKGGASDYIQATDRDTIDALFHAAHAKVIVNAGHWPHAEKPQAFQKLVGDFLRADPDA